MSATPDRLLRRVAAGLILASLAVVGGADDGDSDSDSLDYWLNRAEPADTRPAETTDEPEGKNPFDVAARFGRPDALPGVVELSDGQQIPGRIYTTRDRNLEVWVEAEERFRRVPLITVLSIEPVVVNAEMVQEWRWKEMGVPERVYTGREYPTMRFEWKLHLIDDSTIVGPIKGQPLWVRLKDSKFGPFILHERTKGRMGETLDDIVHLKRVVISRRMMEKVLRAGPPGDAATRPADQ